MLPIIPIAMGISSILGQAGKSRGEAQARNEDNILKRAQVDLQRRQYMRDSPGARVRDAASASMVANFQPASIEWGGPGSGLRGELPKISGAFNNPNMYSPETKQLANSAIHRHLMASLGGEDNLPELPQVGKSNWLDKILGIGGMGAGLIGAVGPHLGGRGRRQAPGDYGDYM